MATHKPTYDFDAPNWAPLEAAVPDDQIGMFMWMYTCIYDDGARIEAYKHRITRHYLLLDQNGNAHVPGDDESLQPLPITDALVAIADEVARLGWPRNATTADEAARLERRHNDLARHHPRRRRR